MSLSTALLVVVCGFALTISALAGEAGSGYACLSSTNYSWHGADGVPHILDCPSTLRCTGTDPTQFPCTGPYPQISGASYSCNPATCQPPNCRCKSNLAPVERPIQMVMITWDDSVTGTTWAVVQRILDFGHKNRNGCNIRTTWFISWEFTVCDLVFEFARRGQELGDHTMTHPSNPPIHEIAPAVDSAARCGQIAKEYVKGFRPPNLASSSWTLDALEELNFTYINNNMDSNYDAGNTFPGGKLWPYTLDHGPGGDCIENCDPKGSYPGLWSIPMNSIQNPTGMVTGMMDPPVTGQELDDLYTGNFMRNYNGNRSPFGIWLHPAWLIGDDSRVAWLNSFLTKILALDDVWVVSGQDVIAYMKNPVQAGATEAPFACPGGTSGPILPPQPPVKEVPPPPKPAEAPQPKTNPNPINPNPNPNILDPRETENFSMRNLPSWVALLVVAVALLKW